MKYLNVILRIVTEIDQFFSFIEIIRSLAENGLRTGVGVG